MLYAHKLLFDSILSRLRQTPYCLLGNLALDLRVSRRTIENCVHLAVGKTFRHLRDEILLERVRSLLASNPQMPVKEVSFAVGFRSPSSFSRAIKRAYGSSPKEFRLRLARERVDSVALSF